MVGSVPAGKALRRSGALPGDQLYVTGRLGGAAAGLAKLAKSGRSPRNVADPARVSATLAPHLYPVPRVLQGLALRSRGLVSAAIDLSDGLSTDLAHLCEESGVGAVLQVGKLPVAPGASLEQAMHGGEDYELLFAARPSIGLPRTIAGVSITRIGFLTPHNPGEPVTMVENGSISPLDSRGWEHFQA